METFRLLVVEDDPDVRALISNVFEHEGYAVDCAATRVGAEACLAEHRYDALIVDAILPDGSALGDFARWRARGLKTLMVTGFPQAMMDLEARGVRYVRKPFRAGDIVDAVERLLSTRAAGA